MVKTGEEIYLILSQKIGEFLETSVNSTGNTHGQIRNPLF